MKHSIVYQRQKPLIDQYISDPECAMICDSASVEGDHLDDPFHTKVKFNTQDKTEIRIGLHKAVGGLHDAPNPGDILCAALATCTEATLRMIANRMSIALLETKVEVEAFVDVRGTLMVDTEIPVHFQRMTLNLAIEVTDNKQHQVPMLIKMTKHCCIVYQTLLRSIPIEFRHQEKFLINQ